MGEKNVYLIKTTTWSKKLKHEFLPPLHFIFMNFPTNMNIDAYPLSSKYSLVDTRMFGDVMHGSESELTFHCVCVCVVWAVCLSFIWVGHVGCVGMRLITANAASFMSRPSWLELKVKSGNTFLKSEQSNIISLYHQTQDPGSGWRIFLSLAGVNDQGYSLDMVMFWYWSLSNTSTWILNPRNHHRHWLKENLCAWQGELEEGRNRHYSISKRRQRKWCIHCTVFACIDCDCSRYKRTGLDQCIPKSSRTFQCY